VDPNGISGRLMSLQQHRRTLDVVAGAGRLAANRIGGPLMS